MSAADAPLDQIVIDLTARVSAARARQQLDLSVDPAVWLHVVALEAEVAAELNRLEPLSDRNAPKLKNLRHKRDVIRRLLSFMLDKSMGPWQLSANTEAVAV